jgi:hypothetical protein
MRQNIPFFVFIMDIAKHSSFLAFDLSYLVHLCHCIEVIEQRIFNFLLGVAYKLNNVHDFFDETL